MNENKFIKPDEPFLLLAGMLNGPIYSFLNGDIGRSKKGNRTVPMDFEKELNEVQYRKYLPSGKCIDTRTGKNISGDFKLLPYGSGFFNGKAGDRVIFHRNVLLSELMTEWFDYHKIAISSSTAYGYERQIIKIVEYFENVKLNKLSEEMLQEYIRYLQDVRGLSNTSINGHCKTLKMALEYAKNKEYIKHNPMDQVNLPKRDRVEIHPFSEYEMKLLLQQECPDWVRDSIFIAYRTGMRLGEIFALEWSDVSFTESFIMVQRSQSRAGSKVKEKTTKTPSGIRRIDIDLHLCQYLHEMMKKSNSKYVFEYEGKKRIPWNISEYVRKMCTSAGIEGRSFHVLRHTHATVLLAHGVHPKIVQERLGHSDTMITMMTYSHITPTIQKQAVDVFEKI